MVMPCLGLLRRVTLCTFRYLRRHALKIYVISGLCAVIFVVKVHQNHLNHSLSSQRHQRHSILQSAPESKSEALLGWWQGTADAVGQQHKNKNNQLDSEVEDRLREHVPSTKYGIRPIKQPLYGASNTIYNVSSRPSTQKTVPTIQPNIRIRPRHPAVPCLLYTSPSPRDATLSRMPSSA